MASGIGHRLRTDTSMFGGHRAHLIIIDEEATMTDEERIQRLEDVVDDLGKSIEELRRGFSTDIRDLQDRLNNEESDREREDTALGDRIDQVERER